MGFHSNFCYNLAPTWNSQCNFNISQSLGAWDL